jgi:hypothetical protein
MKTVQDIYFEVLAMNKQRLPVEQISRKIVEAWHAEHPGVIIERGSTKSVDFDFPTGELISFDGTHWHHRRRPKLPATARPNPAESPFGSIAPVFRREGGPRSSEATG